MHRWLGMVWPRMIPIPAKPFHHKMARCEVSHTTELCKHIALPGQISLCFLLNYFNLELPNKLLSMRQWDSCKSQTPRVTCSESRTFSFRLCCIGITVSLMSTCLMTPCLRSCSGSRLLVRVSPNHNAEGPRALGVCFQPWKDHKCLNANPSYRLQAFHKNANHQSLGGHGACSAGALLTSALRAARWGLAKSSAVMRGTSENWPTMHPP